MNEFEINDRIKALIKKLDMTPYEFSKKIGNDRPDGLYKILKNEVKPSPKTLYKVKKHFPEYYNWLLTGDGEMLKSEEDKRTDLLYTPGASQRVKKIINWLIFIEYAESERDLAQKLGYTMSSFFQIANGRVPLANKFVKKLCAVNNNINEAWIRTGEGEMFLNSTKEAQEITIPKETQETTISTEAWEVIKAQSESLKNKDEQINGLISLLKQQSESLKNKDEQINGFISLLKQQKEDIKKTVAHQEDNVISVG